MIWYTISEWLKSLGCGIQESFVSINIGESGSQYINETSIIEIHAINYLAVSVQGQETLVHRS